MDRFFNPRSIVLFGASSNPRKGGYQVLQNFKQYMERHGYPDFHIVHPREEEISGIPCRSRLADVPPAAGGDGRIDLAVLVVPVSEVMPILRECIARGVRGILIESGNLSDDPREASAFTEEIRSLIKGRDIRIVGPNSIGFNVPDLRYCTPIKHYNQFLETRERNVSIVGQSGLFVTGFVEWFFESAGYGQPFGVANIAAIGNKLDVNESDILEYYLADPKTHAVGMYLEDIRDGKRFSSILKRNRESNRTPIVLLKAGRSERGGRAVASHTGSMAGSYAVVEGVARQFGMVLVDTYEELFGILPILCQYQRIRSNRVGVISVSGSGCVLSSDMAEKYGIDLPALPDEVVARLRPLFPDWAPIDNPLDTWASVEKVGPRESFNRILEIFMSCGLFDSIVMMTIGSPFAAFDWEFMDRMNREYREVPLLAHLFGGQSMKEHEAMGKRYRIPVIPDIERIFKLLGLFSDYSRRTWDRDGGRGGGTAINNY
ncbi:MAG: CoA-binding protein [Spirochaetes bacterium]|nr:CoA-binding protein [Spirochaetota bacterium]